MIYTRYKCQAGVAWRGEGTDYAGPGRPGNKLCVKHVLCRTQLGLCNTSILSPPLATGTASLSECLPGALITRSCSTELGERTTALYWKLKILDI